MNQAERRKQKAEQQRQHQQEIASLSAIELYQRGEYEAAAHKFRSARFLSDEDRLLLADSLFKLQRYEPAAMEFLKLRSTSVQQWIQIGICYINLKKWDEAIAGLTEANNLAQTADGDYWLAVALSRDTICLSSEIEKKVIALLVRAISAPNCPVEAFQLLERIANINGNAEDSLEILKRGLVAHPNSDEIRIRLGELLAEDKPDVAKEILAPLLSSPIRCAEVLWWTFKMELNQGHYDVAINLLMEMANTHGDTSRGPSLRQICGEIYLAIQKWQDAVTCFTTELGNADEAAQILGSLGRARAYLELGEIEAAINDAQVALNVWGSCDVYEMPGCPSLIGIGKQSFYYEHEPDKPIVDAFSADKKRRKCLQIAKCLDYLINRTTELPKLEQLEQLSRNFHLPILDYDLSCKYAESGRLAEAAQHHIQYAIAWFNKTGTSVNQAFYDNELPTARDGARIYSKIVPLIRARAQDDGFATEVVSPFYQGFWREHLVEAKLFNELLDVAQYLCANLPENKQPNFDVAYALHMLSRYDEAESSYRKALQKSPQCHTTIGNMALALESQSKFDAALEFANQATELAPDNKSFQQTRERISKSLDEQKAQEQQRQNFLKTARERWPQVDFHKKRILSTLLTIDRFESLTQLAEMSGTGEQYINGNWRKLVELGMVVQTSDERWVVNEYINDLVKRERSHSVATTLIRADKRIAYKPIFNSRLEYTVYKALISLFPNHLVFPNMSLQTVFQYDRMKELLDTQTFEYFLMSQVDFCVTSTANYLPIIAFEVDSPYHDQPKQQARDEKKNQIFRSGGVPLLRLRAHGEPGAPAIHEQVVEVVRQLGQELTSTADAAGNLVNLSIEIDFERFGNY